MLEKLLRRIAGRSSADTEPAPLSVLAAGEHGQSGMISSASAQDPFSTSYPASGRVRSARSGLTAPGSANAWQHACDAYLKHRAAGGRIADQPAFFADWGIAHMAVAQMLWAEHDRLHLGEATVHCGEALLAVLHPQTRRVTLNASAYDAASALALRQLPPGQAVPLGGKVFSRHTLHALLWFYGQVYAGAPDLLPPEMGEQLIQLRRFPPLEPAALEMRHLALIHVFSGGALSFAQLRKQIPAEHASSLCADLASLYFTGALRLLPP